MNNNNQEKITFNINVMDLAKIDYLVNNGFYSNRSDFLRTALRNQMNVHQAIVSDMVLKDKIEEVKIDCEEKITTSRCLGIMVLEKKNLLDHLSEHKKYDILVFGSLIIDRDIEVDLIKQTVKKLKVYGSIKGSNEVVKYIKNNY
ncbi:hypothetical protein IMX26_06905 [Clostridium sp. 'deep sea']|uniref:hypothetical protein n=1 Tax=Clostridium sp. 'deep sea' TaxID=2779445 RepID=UPI001896530C|nr:hypothetical protein [Clostridium sp. 'deep sea']QOR36531.1 hypothetical protein IMX26_06905 [Clostridium sp. 'deep sea']